MDDLERTQLEQVLRLAKDNNRMLRAIRRDAFIGGIIKFIVWMALIIIPFWLYLNYLAPVVQSAAAAMQQIQEMQGATAGAQAQFGELTEALNSLKGLFPQYFQQ